MNQDIQLSREQRAEARRQLVDSMRASQTASDMMDEAFCDFLGINRSDGRCVDVVDRLGQVTAGELAREVGLSTGAITAMVDRLEAGELLERKTDSNDRRKVLIELTPEAKGLVADVYGPLAQATQPFLESISDSNLLTLIALFDAGRRAHTEIAQTVMERSSKRKVTLRYRIEQARALKEDAKALFKTIKSEMKDLFSVVIITGDTCWQRDEHGNWVEVPGDQDSV